MFSINSKHTNQLDIIKSYLKWVVLSVLVGCIIGIIGSAFHFSIDESAKLFAKYSNIIFLLPIAGVIIPFLYKIADMEKDLGTNSAIIAIRESKNITLKTAPLIFISTVLTHLTGGSSGREGAALQLGSSIANSIGKMLKLDYYDRKLITMCGMSAGFSALFGTPITAAVFSIEVVGVGIMHYSALVPCFIASISGYLISTKLGVLPTSFALKTVPDLTALNLTKVIVLSAIAAFLSILFCIVLHFAGKLYKKISNTSLRGFAGGLLVLVITLILGTRDYNGAGIAVIQKAINGEAMPFAFIIKILLTALTLGAGFKGGEIVPAFFTGATFGCTFAHLLNLDYGFGGAIGLISVFCGVTNCPLASLFLALELFGNNGFIFFGLACATSFMLSGYSGLYSEQTIIYSKTKPLYVNQKTK